MSRLPLVSVENSSEQSRLVFEQVRKAMGKLPNAYALIGGYSPNALSLLLSGDAALAKGQLSRQEIEAVRLAISTQNGCDYCVAAHSAVGKMVGLPAAELTQLRAGQPTGHNKRDALVGFARPVEPVNKPLACKNGCRRNRQIRFGLGALLQFDRFPVFHQ